MQRNLERLGDLLAKIQKALGEYLERERSAFPRFYFVGDEDLLEIIGNSKAWMNNKLTKHCLLMIHAGKHGEVILNDLIWAAQLCWTINVFPMKFDQLNFYSFEMNHSKDSCDFILLCYSFLSWVYESSNHTRCDY